MKSFRLNDNKVSFRADDLEAPLTIKDNILITSVTVEQLYGHDHIRVFNRGAHAGTIRVRKGDGEAIAKRLLGGT